MGKWCFISQKYDLMDEVFDSWRGIEQMIDKSLGKTMENQMKPTKWDTHTQRERESEMIYIYI